MEMKERIGSERLKPDSWRYLANGRALQGALSSHPQDNSPPVACVVKKLDRGPTPLFAFLLAEHQAEHRHGLVAGGSEP
jgi:hypothetical protein